MADGVEDEGHGGTGDLASSDAVELAGEPGAEKGFGNPDGVEIGEQAVDGVADGGLGPVVAHAVAVAVATEETLLLGCAVVVRGPLAGVGEHGGFDDVGERRALGGGDELRFDGGEGEEGFAHGKGEGWADLEDGEAVVDEVGVGLGALVVGGVGFKDKAVGRLEEAGEIAGFFGGVVDDSVVVELDAGLDDQADDARPCCTETAGVKGFAVDAEGFGGGGRGGDGEALHAFRGAAGDGDLGADDVHGRGTGGGVFGGFAEIGGAGGDELLGEWGGVVGAGHAGVEMELAEAGGCVLSDHDLCGGHGFGGSGLLPGIGAEVIATEEDAFGGKTELCGNVEDEPAEVGGLHAGVAAVLVDLVGGGFDEDWAAVVEGLPNGGADDPGVGGTDGVDAAGGVGRVEECEVVLKPGGHVWGGSPGC